MELKRKINRLAKLYDVKVHYFSNKDENSSTGYVDVRESYIFIKKRKCEKEMLKTFFHELGHIYCYRNNKWFIYHNFGFEKHTKSFEMFKKFKRTAYRAECYVDVWGKNEMKKHFPKIKYSLSYEQKDKRAIKWLNNYYKKFYSEWELYFYKKFYNKNKR